MSKVRQEQPDSSDVGTVICSECGAEADPQRDQEDLPNEGWDLDGEFGARCPECVSLRSPIAQENEGLDGVAAVVEAAEKKAPRKRRRKKAEK